MATGVTWRQEAYDVRGDGAGNGTIGGSDGAPGSACNDPLLNCLNGTNWYAGSFHNGQGNYHVLEGFVEFNVPLINSPEWGNANLNIAGRHARYSTAGDSNTWKVGVTWDTPMDGLRLRALQSRDVRAPNLSELFAAPVTANGSSNIPANAGNPATSVQVIQGTLGNPLLKPERSLNTQVGFVMQPSWLQGWQFSLDYYRLYVAGEISTVPQQTNVNNCFAGLSQYCSAIVTCAGHHAVYLPAAMAAGEHPVLQRGVDGDGRLQSGNLLPVQPGGLGLHAGPRRLHRARPGHLCGQVHHQSRHPRRHHGQHAPVPMTATRRI